MNKLTKKLSKTVAILMAATTIASTGIISAGANNYGSSSTAAASKGGYKIYKYGISGVSYTTILNVSGKSRFVIPQVIVLKKGNNGYSAVDYSNSNEGVVKTGGFRTATVPQSSSTRKYWHRGVLNNNTSYSSGSYYIYDYKIKF